MAADDVTNDDTPLAPTPVIPRGVWLLLGAKLLITIATLSMTTILGKQVWDISHSELDLGFLGLAEFLPTALLSPITGSIADRHDRRIVSAIGLAASAAVAFGLWAYAGSDQPRLWPIYCLVVVFGAARALSGPAIRALPVDLSPRALITRVVALSSGTFQVGVIVGPVVAGFLFVASEPAPYLFSAVLLVVAAITLTFVPASEVARLTSARGLRSALRDASEGLTFIRRTPVLFGAISLDLFAVLFGGAVALLPAIAEERLGVGAIGLGWLRAATGIGAAVVSIALAARPLSRHVGHKLLTMVALFGAATLVLGLTRSFAVAFIALLVLSGADAVSVFIRSTIVPLATPDNMRGRVLATENVFIGASNELGAFESGVTGSLFGLVGAIMIGGVGTLAVVGLWAVFFPKLRKIDRFSELHPAEH
ncbi:MAG: MFS transporter [Acidimicrobiales bacterium]